MSPGKTFGKFVAEEPLSGHGGRVLLAHQRGSQELGGYVVKLVSVGGGGSEAGAVARRWLDGISFQDRVAQDWHDVVAPIVDRPTKAAEVVEALNTGEVWYVTRRYDASLNEVLDQLGGNAASPLALWMICRAVARGAVAFKQVDAPSGGRRSHGKLSPGNVLIKGLPIAEGQTEIVVTDPAAVLEEGSAVDTSAIEDEFEKRDLLALGRILFQLVAGRRLGDDWNWADAWNSPEGNPNRWKLALGKAANSWRSLCQELLASEGARRPSLADIDHRIGEMRPRPPKSKVPLIATAAAVVLGIVLGVVWGLRDTAVTIVVRVPEVPGLTADVSVYPVGDPAAGEVKPLIDGQAVFKVTPLEYRITLQPTGAFRRLNAPESQRRAAEARRQVTNIFELEIAELRVGAVSETGSPVPGELVLAGETEGTRLASAGTTSLYLPYITNKLYNVDIKPDAESGFSPVQLSVLLNRVQPLVSTNVVLQRAVAGLADVKFGSDYDLPLTYRYRNNAGEEIERSDSFWEKFRRGDSITVRVQPPYPWPESVIDWVVPETNVVEFPRGFSKDTRLRFDWSDNDPARTELWVAAGTDEVRSIGNLLDRQLMAFPSRDAQYRFVFQRTGFEPLTNLVAIRSGITNDVAVPPLKAIYGIVELAGNLPGITVYTNGAFLKSTDTTNVTLHLPPDVPHELSLVYSNEFGVLNEQRLRTRVGPGGSTNLPYRFDYVRVEFAVEPTNALIQRVLADGSVARVPGGHFLQNPGDQTVFRFSAEHFKERQLTASRATGGSLPIPVVLEPMLYGVVLQVEPPTAALRGARDKLSVGTGPTSLKFGTYELEAWHPLLGSQVKEFTIDPLNVQTHRWELDYGAVDILTGQDGLKVKLFPQDSAVAARLSEFAGGNDWPREDFTTMWRTPITNAFLPPGKYRIEFTDDEQKAEREFEVARRVSPGEPPARHQFTDVAFLPATFQSSLGITLSKLVGQSTYISLVRLTRGQFNQIMDASLPETAYSDRPVVTRDEQDRPHASIANMEEFCRRLTERDRALFQPAFRGTNWVYDLPTVDEWRAGAVMAGFDASASLGEIARGTGANESRYYYAEAGNTGAPLQATGVVLSLGLNDVTFRLALRKQR